MHVADNRPDGRLEASVAGPRRATFVEHRQRPLARSRVVDSLRPESGNQCPNSLAVAHLPFSVLLEPRLVPVQFRHSSFRRRDQCDGLVPPQRSWNDGAGLYRFAHRQSARPSGDWLHRRCRRLKASSRQAAHCNDDPSRTRTSCVRPSSTRGIAAGSVETPSRVALRTPRHWCSGFETEIL